MAAKNLFWRVLGVAVGVGLVAYGLFNVIDRAVWLATETDFRGDPFIQAGFFAGLTIHLVQGVAIGSHAWFGQSRASVVVAAGAVPIAMVVVAVLWMLNVAAWSLPEVLRSFFGQLGTELLNPMLVVVYAAAALSIYRLGGGRLERGFVIAAWAAVALIAMMWGVLYALAPDT